MKTYNPEVTVVKEMSFDAAHFLPEYEGKCKNLHGHTYKVQVGVKGRVNSKTGMVCDFGILKNKMANLVSLLDHSCLNNVMDKGFPNHNPTAELMVLWFATELMEDLSKTGQEDVIFPAFIRIWETPTCYAEVNL